ncbi:Quinone oxidoreductase PIG3, partial [Bienertia sinuspersici]
CCNYKNPLIKEDEVLIKKGSYPPPVGGNPYPFPECSRIILQVGTNVTHWKVGDQMCALLSGGGYAEKVAIPAEQVLLVPDGVSLKDACLGLFIFQHVHGGSSRIGTFAIQFAKYHGAKALKKNYDFAKIYEQMLNLDGRLFIIGLQGGATTQIKLAGMHGRRLIVQGMLKLCYHPHSCNKLTASCNTF